jgi:hypothetical protein
VLYYSVSLDGLHWKPFRRGSHERGTTTKQKDTFNETDGTDDRRASDAVNYLVRPGQKGRKLL